MNDAWTKKALDIRAHSGTIKEMTDDKAANLSLRNTHTMPDQETWFEGV